MVTPSLCHKYKTRVSVANTSLFHYGNNYGRKKYYSTVQYFFTTKLTQIEPAKKF